MTIQEILSKCDHTLLSPTATFEDIKALCDDAVRFKTASVCIPPCYVKRAKEYAGDKIPICTVVGFPLGYSTTLSKCTEAAEAVENGADEIDMVINIGELKAGNYDFVGNEISAVKAVCGDKILKVIIETCLLTEDEKKKMCEVVSRSCADFIKTSTGFSTGGATFDDIKLFDDNVAFGIGIKAAGGISTLEDAEKFIELGADRLGTSKIVKIAKETM